MRRIAAALAVALLVGSCAGPAETTSPTFRNLAPVDPAPPVPDLDEQAVALGAQVYGQYCASCHGADLGGEPDWKIPNADGTYPAPPHDETGHTWHHSDATLTEIVTVGVDVAVSRMPTYGDLLTEDEIQAVLEFLKSNWGPEEREFQWQVTWQDSQLGG